ncbi:neuropeptide-like 1 isoform X4 [Phlebotomus argentipes]|uniref:neuropeptide-like 1 isoform X4 n=1 Tax=Phlebotomus argentipes TaxID=94469 RepID=UPI0028933864|nr:neuropeptide-like 1 isoform X4 [Phlebotomus argentipes]
MGKSKLFFSTRLLFPTAATLCLLIQSVHPQPPQTGVINPCILDQILNLISIPDDGYDIHQRIALRNRLRSILERAIDDSDYQRLDGDGSEGDFLADKRSINSLARAGLFPKRNLGSVLRTGGFQRTGGENGGGGKRSLASLAKTGQLPSKEPDAEIAPSSLWLENKRNLGALARSGNFYLTGKRNLAALARGNLLPLAKREWIEEERRSIGALARDWALPNQKNKDEEEEELKEKKNIGALKNSPIHGVRQKRQASYTDFEDGTFEVPEPVVQTSPVDYEDILESLNSLNSNAHFEDKRYLGRIFPPTRPTSATYRQRV